METTIVKKTGKKFVKTFNFETQPIAGEGKGASQNLYQIFTSKSRKYATPFW